MTEKTLGKLFMIVGIPGSGKSTAAQKLKEKHNASIISSDEIRKGFLGDENNQDNNAKVFDIMYEHAQQFLNDGQSIILDSTNISRKKRIHVINNVLKASEYHAVYLATPFEHCVSNDMNRYRNVGYEVVDKMFRNLEIPTILEGWNSIEFDYNYQSKNTVMRKRFENSVTSEIYTHDELFANLFNCFYPFGEIVNIPQDSKYHSFSISRHTYYVWDYIRKEYAGKNNLAMLIAAMFHDLGKAHTKSFINYKGETKRYASFIGHEHVSAQLAAEALNNFGYDDLFIKYVVDLIQFHMKPMNMSEKQEKKLRGLLTEEQYNDLMFLHEADTEAK